MVGTYMEHIWNIYGCVLKNIFFFFSQSELHYIYTQQLEKHFIIHASQSQHTASDTSSQEATVEGHSHHHGSGDQDKAMRDLLSGITYVTVELQDHLRSMFLPTSQRCHYIFTMTDLTMVFRYGFNSSREFSQSFRICSLVITSTKNNVSSQHVYMKPCLKLHCIRCFSVLNRFKLGFTLCGFKARDPPVCMTCFLNAFGCHLQRALSDSVRNFLKKLFVMLGINKF